ncbi:MAG: ribulose-phosphate 3-epimerase [Ruminococcaceae bacterium]|nr:ribulose-phosphate 3-epimerase [Oscillospiraceae bacterium]
MIKLSPSLLAADFSNLKNDIEKAECAGCDMLHLDVMDGAFVPNISFGMPVISSLKKISNIVFDVHLMINDPIRYIEDFVKCGADIITFHYESCDDPLAVIEKIKSFGVKAAISIKPKTDASVLEPFIDKVDMVLVMTVEPGFGGQKLIPETLDKVAKIAETAKEKGVCPDIQVDGGITLENAHLAVEKGANVLVAGSAVFGASDISEAVRKFKSL